MPDYTIAVLDKAIRVLQAMSEAQRPATLTEIVRTVGESKNAVFRILRTLEKHGFAAQVEGRWALGMDLHKMVDADVTNKFARWKQGYSRRKRDVRSDGTGKNGRAPWPQKTPIA